MDIDFLKNLSALPDDIILEILLRNPSYSDITHMLDLMKEIPRFRHWVHDPRIWELLLLRRYGVHYNQLNHKIYPTPELAYQMMESPNFSVDYEHRTYIMNLHSVIALIYYTWLVLNAFPNYRTYVIVNRSFPMSEICLQMAERLNFQYRGTHIPIEQTFIKEFPPDQYHPMWYWTSLDLSKLRKYRTHIQQRFPDYDFLILGPGPEYRMAPIPKEINSQLQGFDPHLFRLHIMHFGE